MQSSKVPKKLTTLFSPGGGEGVGKHLTWVESVYTQTRLDKAKPVSSKRRPRVTERNPQKVPIRFPSLNAKHITTCKIPAAKVPSVRLRIALLCVSSRLKICVYMRRNRGSWQLSQESDKSNAYASMPPDDEDARLWDSARRESQHMRIHFRGKDRCQMFWFLALIYGVLFGCL